MELLKTTPEARPLRSLRRLLELDEELVRRHQKGLWRYLRFLGAGPALADDLTQEAFLALLDDPPEDRGEAAAAAWLRTTGRRLYLREGRRPRAGLELLGDGEVEQTWLALAGRHPPAEGDGYLAALHDCLEPLPERHRQALLLRYADGASRHEMAVALGIGEEGVKTMLRRLRDALQDCVEDKVRRGK